MRFCVYPAHPVNPVRKMPWLSWWDSALVFGSVEAGFSSEFQAGSSEVEEEAEVHLGGGQVVDELGFVGGAQRLIGFEFDHDFGGDKEIGFEFSDDDAVVVDRELLFAFEGNARFAEFVLKGFVIDGFEKTRAKGGVDFHGASDDRFGEF